MTPQTRTNLTTAMEREAFSNAQCSRFAAHARMHDNHEVALLFQTAADVDRCEHFEKEFHFAELIGSDLENLGLTLHEKFHQIELYARFEKQADSEGDTGAASLFKSIHADELRQVGILTLAKERLEGQMRMPPVAVG